MARQTAILAAATLPVAWQALVLASAALLVAQHTDLLASTNLQMARQTQFWHLATSWWVSKYIGVLAEARQIAILASAALLETRRPALWTGVPDARWKRHKKDLIVLPEDTRGAPMSSKFHPRFASPLEVGLHSYSH